MRVYVTHFLVIFTSIPNKSSSILFCLIFNKNPFIILIDQFDLILMVDSNFISSSKSTFAFDRLSIYTNNRKERFDLKKAIICFNEKNFNQKANHINENLKKETNILHRLSQSSTDIRLNNLHSSKNRINSHKNNGIIRIESALMTSDYSHLLNHSLIDASQPIIDRNMNKTIDLIKQNELKEKNLLSHSNDKEIKTPSITNNYHYLILEQVPIHNRRKIQVTAKQLIFISISVFIFVIVISLMIIFFIF